jgi:glycosyltransferase involved in cell wall biosynthesis
VLHRGKFFPPHPGGIERCTADLCAALHAHGVDSAVLAHAEFGSPGRRFHAADGYEVTLAACHGRILYAPLSPAFPRLLHRVLARWRPDLLHLHVPNTSAFWALLSPAARRLPWIVHWHADIPVDTRRRALRAAYSLYRPWEQALLRRCAAIVATSQAYADSSAALAPWRSKTHVIALGIPPLATPLESSRLTGSASEDATAVQSLPHSPTPLPQGERGSSVRAATSLPEGERGLGFRTAAVNPETSLCDGLRLLTVGRLSYFKGIDVLLRALVDVPAANLTIIGDGECRAALERLARELAIQARVAFAGRIDMDGAGAATIAEAYAQCDVFCLPSTDRAESFGLVLLEAMRAQRAVVASAIPGSGVGYVVRDGETGLLVPPGDAAALAGALRRLGDDAALRERLAAAGRRRWQAEFTLERSAEQVLQLYRSLV